MGSQRKRRTFFVLIIAIIAAVITFTHESSWQQPEPEAPAQAVESSPAPTALEKLEIKGRAPKTGYERTQFGNGWSSTDGCDTRNIILGRDMQNVAVGDECKVQTGSLADPYTGKTIQFARGVGTSDDVQIDHVVALSDAWQKGAQLLTPEQREKLANDPLELLAVDGASNQQKSASDAASWLPPNKAFRCQYVARQIAVKLKYELWVTRAEYDAMKQVLARCPNQALPSA